MIIYNIRTIGTTCINSKHTIQYYKLLVGIIKVWVKKTKSIHL